jgi:uncharacterized membrane protein YvbJ
MKCLLCNFENPATVGYCKQCGKKIDLSHDEIKQALEEKAALESAKNVEYQASQFIVLAAAFFFLMLTLLVLARGLRPDDDHLVFIPAVSLHEKATYAEIPYEFMPTVEPVPLPFEAPAK